MVPLHCSLLQCYLNIDFRYLSQVGENMKIAISSTGAMLDDLVDPRFGRCSYYIVVNPETLEFDAVKNTGAHMQ